MKLIKQEQLAQTVGDTFTLALNHKPVKKSETAGVNRYNPTVKSKFGGVIPAPAYAEWRKVQKPKPVSARRAHRLDVKARGL